MATYYLETSALTKLYLKEPGTENMIRLASEAGPASLAVLTLAKVEFRSAVRRREREGDLSGSEASRILNAFQNHFSEGWFLSVPLTDAIVEEALRLVDRRLLRAYDAVQLAGCISLGRIQGNWENLIFVCADKELSHAAREEALEVLDPGRTNG